MRCHGTTGSGSSGGPTSGNGLGPLLCIQVTYSTKEMTSIDLEEPSLYPKRGKDPVSSEYTL